MMRTISLLALFLFSLVATASSSSAHQVSAAFLEVEKLGTELDVTWDASVKDLDLMYGLDANEDGSIVWSEVVSLETALTHKAQSLVGFSVGGKVCVPLTPSPIQVRERSFGPYLVFNWKVSCPNLVDTVALDYRFLAEVDPGHTVFMKLRAGESLEATAITPGVRDFNVSKAATTPLEAFVAYLGHGVHHILFGPDHLAFLIVLLIPTVLPKDRSDPAPTFWKVCKSVAIVVTAFTVAHSLTLALAVLRIVNVPSYFVEAAVAFSIFFSALLNVFGARGTVRTSVAFIFGLLHGFGFATILLEENLPTGAIATALVGFNAGVEVGQLGVVFLILPMLFFLARSKSYELAVLRIASMILSMIGLYWFLERIGVLTF